MSSDLNKFVFSGRATMDPVIRVFNSKDGTPRKMATFSVANNKIYKKGTELAKDVNFFNCVAFGYLADTIEKNLHKGDGVLVSGSLAMNDFVTKTGEKRRGYDVNLEYIQINSVRKAASEKDNIPQEDSEAPVIDGEEASTPLEDDTPFN
jgi:single-strand DNA-binding protein